jgi:hypothetical protein
MKLTDFVLTRSQGHGKASTHADPMGAVGGGRSRRRVPEPHAHLGAPPAGRPRHRHHRPRPRRPPRRPPTPPLSDRPASGPRTPGAPNPTRPRRRVGPDPSVRRPVVGTWSSQSPRAPGWTDRGVIVGTSGRGLPPTAHAHARSPKTRTQTAHNHGPRPGILAHARHRRPTTRTRTRTAPQREHRSEPPPTNPAGRRVTSEARGRGAGYWPSTSRMPSPYLASFDSPTPLIPASSPSEDGAASAIARSVASWKTT